MAASWRRCALDVRTLLLLLASVAIADQQPAIVYHVNVRLYHDADGDGVGDLAGVTENLGSLAELGVDVLWLSPIFTSASEYHVGHKISNLTEVDPVFGDMASFQELVQTATSLGMQVLLEVVPNHTSDSHEWFELSVERQEPYTDYYVWDDGVDKDDNNDREPPNNWLSVTGGSAWTWNEERSQYFLHQFGDMQPDLNYWNKEVRREMEEVLRFWLEHGVSGFVLSSISHLYESKDLQDEPLHSPGEDRHYSHLEHNYTLDLPETYQQVYQWHKLIEEFGSNDNLTRFLVVESHSNLQSTLSYYGSEDEPVADMPLNFRFLSSLQLNNSAKEIETAITDWLINMPTGSTANWMVGSNTLNDIAAHFSAHQVDNLNAMLQLLPGVTVVYNGDLTAETSWDETTEYGNQFVGDEEYTSFNWDLSTPFSSAATVPGNNETNLLEQNSNPTEGKKIIHEPDVLSRLLNKISLRRSIPTLQLGDIQVSAVSADVLLLVRTLVGGDTFVAVINFGDNSASMNISVLMENVISVIVHSSSSNSGLKEGDEIPSSKVTLPPSASVVMRLSYAPLDSTATSTEEFDLQTELFTQDMDDTEATTNTTEMSSPIFDNSTEVSTTYIPENVTEISTEADNMTADTSTATTDTSTETSPATTDTSTETSEVPDNSTEILFEMPDNSTEMYKVASESAETSTDVGGIENSTEISTAADGNDDTELYSAEFADNVTSEAPQVSSTKAHQQTEPNAQNTTSKVGEQHKSHLMFALVLLVLLAAALL